MKHADGNGGLVYLATHVSFCEPSAEPSISICGAGIGYPPSDAPSLLKKNRSYEIGKNGAVLGQHHAESTTAVPSASISHAGKDRRVILRVAPHLNTFKAWGWVCAHAKIGSQEQGL